MTDKYILKRDTNGYVVVQVKDEQLPRANLPHTNLPHTNLPHANGTALETHFVLDPESQVFLDLTRRPAQPTAVPQSAPVPPVLEELVIELIVALKLAGYDSVSPRPSNPMHRDIMRLIVSLERKIGLGVHG